MSWKWLQRLTYVAAIALAMHWAVLARMAPDVMIQIGLVIVLETVRVALWVRKFRRPARQSRA